MNSPPVQFAHLATFRELVRHGNYTRAAQALHVTQPAVTQHVRALERHYGVKLVDIVGRRMQLTQAGAFFAEHAERVLDVAATLERDMREFADVESGELRLGATVTIGSYGLAAIVARFHERYPLITLNVRVENTRQIAADVLRGALSLALVEGEVEDSALEVVPYQNDVLTLVVPNGHRFARRKTPVKPSDLAGERFVAREEGSGTRALFETVLRRAGIVPNVVLALPTGEGVTEAVEAGVGIAVVSSLVTRAAVDAGRLRQVDVSALDFRRTLQLVRRKRLTPSPAASAFANIALEFGGLHRSPAALAKLGRRK
jgi:DNA-binding transcriptional LysR family regulator